jgi:uncharacterized BrkB/YihY/UPF0761 family membrane protein
MSSYLKLQGAYSARSGADFFDTSLAIFYLVLTTTGPFFFMYFFTVNESKLQKDKKFLKKYHTAFEATKTNKIYNIYYHAFFMLRRLIFVLSCIYLEGILYTF